MSPKKEHDLREVGIKELAVSADAVIKRVEEGQRVVVTRRRRPAAVLIPISDVREFVLAYAPEFAEMRRLSREEHAAGESTPVEAVWDSARGGTKSARADQFAIRIANGVREPLSASRFPARRAWNVVRQLSIRAAPLRVVVATHLDGFPRRDLEDTD